MTVGDENVQQPSLSIIEKGGAPAHHEERGVRDLRGASLRSENPSSQVAVQRIGCRGSWSRTSTSRPYVATMPGPSLPPCDDLDRHGRSTGGDEPAQGTPSRAGVHGRLSWQRKSARSDVRTNFHEQPDTLYRNLGKTDFLT